MADTQYDQLRMFIIDVLRHGGGSTFDGLIARLNDDGGIGWKDVVKEGFNPTQVRELVDTMILDGSLLVEDMNNHHNVLAASEALAASLDISYLLTNSPKSLKLWEKWKPPANSQ
jgi:hypothetical protein